MQSANNARRAPRLFALVDAAANPAVIHPLLEKSGVEFQSVFTGLPEEKLGPASLFLASIDDIEADWVAELDRIDLHSPCLSLVFSRVEMSELAAHLQAFLFVDIGDGMTAMLRFFDPRNTDSVLKVWGDQIADIFMGPIERWLYRGRHSNWQRIENDSLTGARLCRSIKIRLTQADVDALTAHTEPDELLATLIQTGLVDGELPYLERRANFIPRYERALQWGLTEAADRLKFCQLTYCYGLDFDRHPRVHAALSIRRTTDAPLSLGMERVPAYAWAELTRKNRTFQ